jgi:hypothetical protein
MAWQDHGRGGASSSGDLVSPVGRTAIVTRTRTTRLVGGRPQTPGDELAAADSFDRPHSSNALDCSDADAASFSHQAATVGLQRIGFEDLDQRGVSTRRGATETFQEVPGHSRAQRQPSLCFFYTPYREGKWRSVTFDRFEKSSTGISSIFEFSISRHFILLRVRKHMSSAIHDEEICNELFRCLP